MSYKSVFSLEDLYAVASVEDKALAETLEERMELIKHKVKFVKNRPNIICLQSVNPLVIAGKWIPSLIYNAGGQPLLTEERKGVFEITFDELIASDPDGILFSLEGKTLSETKAIVSALLTNANWQALRAVQKGHVFIADGVRYFHTAGPEIIDTGELIAEILQVNQFYYGMEGEFWEQIA